MRIQHSVQQFSESQSLGFIVQEDDLFIVHHSKEFLLDVLDGHLNGMVAHLERPHFGPTIGPLHLKRRTLYTSDLHKHNCNTHGPSAQHLLFHAVQNPLIGDQQHLSRVWEGLVVHKDVRSGVLCLVHLPVIENNNL